MSENGGRSTSLGIGGAPPRGASPRIIRAISRLLTPGLCVAGLLLACGASVWAHADPQPSSDTPPQQMREPTLEIPFSPTVSRLLDDDVTSEAEQRRLALFHGQWDRLNDLTVAEEAERALYRFDLDHPSLAHEQAPALVRAEAALWRGEPQQTLELLADREDAPALLLRGRAHQMRGELAEAVRLLTPLRERLQFDTMDDARHLTAAAEATLLLARLEGRPSQDYHLAIRMFAKAREELDRLYWPAHLAEAKLLMARDNASDAHDAATDALRLNPRASEAIFLLGSFAARNFNFDMAQLSLAELRRINPEHLLAAVLEGQLKLVQRDVDGARAAIELGLTSFPQQRDLLALLAATEALAYDEQGMRRVFDHYEALSPNSAEPYYVVGSHLSFARQYEAGEAMLRQAIEREPNWPEPRIELGLLLMQSGDEQGAALALRRAAQLDPFHRRANNQLQLVEALLQYEQIEVGNFIIKYQAGIDEVLARDMALVVEQIYDSVTAAFDHEPVNPTLIEIMPDEEWFGVRITGMPEIWTIAACTGDVISMTPPRSGPLQRGAYHWKNVLQHEFAHTVTLCQTANRIPHWFTEACAVSVELTGRSYNTCRMLAQALHADRLFSLDEINWGFIRPRSPMDRPLAYAQSDWMLEYIAVEHGHDAIVDMLTLFREGVSDVDAITQVLGQTPDQFMEQFTSWAHQQVAEWGLQQWPAIEELSDSAAAANLSDDQIATLVEAHPDHPEVLRAAAGRAMLKAEADPRRLNEAQQAVLRYAVARPVDPWPYRQIVLLAQRMDRLDELIPALEHLDRQEQEHGRWAFQLARLHRTEGRLDDAAHFATRALYREPYNAEFRELAATIELQRGDADGALHHMHGLAIVEPTRAVHEIRLAALYHRLGEIEASRAAAKRALEIDPDADVARFLPEGGEE